MEKNHRFLPHIRLVDVDVVLSSTALNLNSDGRDKTAILYSELLISVTGGTRIVTDRNYTLLPIQNTSKSHRITCDG